MSGRNALIERQDTFLSGETPLSTGKTPVSVGRDASPTGHWDGKWNGEWDGHPGRHASTETQMTANPSFRGGFRTAST